MKTYNGEKAIISITSWKKRINTVSKTIFSIIQHCPDYHIVLVLSEDEFPKKENELPSDLLAMTRSYIEILWVKRNYKSFKKILFTAQKYPAIPVISADDGCIYTMNFADQLYNRWLTNTTSIISFNRFGYSNYVWGGGGYGILFPPSCFLNYGIQYLSDEIINTNHDDAYYGALSNLLGIKWVFLFYDPKYKPFKEISEDIKSSLGGINRKFKDSDILKIFNLLQK